MTSLHAIALNASELDREKSIFELLEDPAAAACLPSLASVLNELQSVTKKTNVNLEEVAKLVELDVTMSSRVLRIANSAYYAPAEPVVDVQEAILHMGLCTFRRAVLATNCIEMTSLIPQTVLDWKEFWLHAAGVGHLNLELASHLETPHLDPESFYLMGLMHDIGKVVLAQTMPEKFENIYLQAAVEKKSPAELELETIGVDHGQLGSWYLERQTIPAVIYQPIRFHHCLTMEDKPHYTPARLIKLADLLTRFFLLGQSGNHTETGDPFLSEEWKWYVEISRPSDTDGNQFKDALIEKVARISDLVRSIIT